LGHFILKTVCFCGTTGISSSNSLVQHPAADTMVLALMSLIFLTFPFSNFAPNSNALFF